jgi:hypothetical protein
MLAREELSVFLRSVGGEADGVGGFAREGIVMVQAKSAWWAGRKYQVPRTRACPVQALCRWVRICQRRVDDNPQDSDSRIRIVPKLG